VARKEEVMDGKKKVFCCAFFLISFVTQCSIQLLVDSATQYTAVVGEQFELDLVMKDLGKTGKEPVFSGDTPLLFQRTGLYMTSLNGKTEIKYTYQVRFDTVGSYTIGPVKIMHGGKEYLSNAVTVTVSYGSDAQSGLTKKKDVFLELSVDTEFPIVGQEVILTLSCFVRKKDVQIESVTQPQLAQPELFPEGKHSVEDRVIDTVFYKVVSWRWKFVPEKAGDMVIPAASVLYTTSENTAQHFFFSLMSPAKRIFSNAVKLSVQNLPAYDKPVNGIGHFTHFSASLSSARIMQGEAATLTLILEGKGSIVQGLNYQLSAMPKNVKYYPVATKKEPHRYIFEYIVQAVEPGECIIPAQEFIFFNIHTKQYETISTTPLEMRITKDDSFDSEQNTKQQEKEKRENNQQEKEELFGPENTKAISDTTSIWFTERTYPQNLTLSQPIPWWLFFIVLILLLLIKIGYLLVYYVLGIQQRMQSVYFFLYCSFCARYRLYRIIQKDAIGLLYPLFCDLIACRYQCSFGQTYKYIDTIAVAIAAHEKEKDWERFWRSISLPVYSLRSFDIQQRMKLYQDAAVFIRVFTKIK
jgi:hypothetical protein